MRGVEPSDSMTSMMLDTVRARVGSREGEERGGGEEDSGLALASKAKGGAGQVGLDETRGTSDAKYFPDPRSRGRAGIATATF